MGEDEYEESSSSDNEETENGTLQDESSEQKNQLNLKSKQSSSDTVNVRS
jgi:hypothetical protein